MRTHKSFAKVAAVDQTAAVLAKPGARLKKPSKRHSGAVTSQSQALAREREARVWTLVAQGKSPGYIAQELGYKLNSVYVLIRRIEKRYNEMTVASMGEMKARQVHQLQSIVEASLQAFEESKKPASKVTHEKGTMGGERGETDIDITKSTVEKQVGDHRFLETAVHCLADIRGIYGLDAPKPMPGFNPADLPSGTGSYRVEWSNDAQPRQAPVEAQARPIDDRYLPRDMAQEAQGANESGFQDDPAMSDWSEPEDGSEDEGGLVE
jgi:DNA-binding CsgD family transcriptional regulator